MSEPAAIELSENKLDQAVGGATPGLAPAEADGRMKWTPASWKLSSQIGGGGSA